LSGAPYGYRYIKKSDTTADEVRQTEQGRLQLSGMVIDLITAHPKASMKIS
jgi:hypothetical protein